jgi:hypothetical protein
MQVTFLLLCALINKVSFFSIVEHLCFKAFKSFVKCYLWCDPSRDSASHLEASCCWVLSVVVSIEKQSNRVSAIGACLALCVDDLHALKSFISYTLKHVVNFPLCIFIFCSS